MSSALAQMWAPVRAKLCCSLIRWLRGRAFRWQTGAMAQQTVRVDKWLWSVRVYKTRSQASEGCKSGRVRVNDEIAKPSSKLVVGDRVEARLKERTTIYVVVGLLEKRVGAALAADAYDDHSPPVISSSHSSGYGGGDAGGLDPGVREPGAGRPTKKDRREIQRFRGRD